MKKVGLRILFLGYVLCKVAYAIDLSPTLPLKDRVKESAVIFVGRAVSQEAMKTPTVDMDTMATFEVVSPFKGNISAGQKVQVYFRLHHSNPAMGEMGSDLSPKGSDGYQYEAEHVTHTQILVYAKKLDGKFFTSLEMGGGASESSLMRAEIEQLKKELGKSWWQRLF